MSKHLLIVAGLVAGASPALAQSSEYRAVGTEPFWSVSIERGRMTYESAEGRRVSVALPRAVSTVDGRVYRSRQLIMRIQVGRRCSDGMSDRVYADTVRVTVNGRELDGCGEPPRGAETLAGTRWEIVRIGSERVAGPRYRIDFETNRLSGSAGCNRFSGTYRVGRDGLQAGPLAMTRMACPGAAMRHEAAVSRLLNGRVRLSYPDRNTLVMRGVSGGEIRLRRSGP